MNTISFNRLQIFNYVCDKTNDRIKAAKACQTFDDLETLQKAENVYNQTRGHCYIDTRTQKFKAFYETWNRTKDLKKALAAYNAAKQGEKLPIPTEIKKLGSYILITK